MGQAIAEGERRPRVRVLLFHEAQGTTRFEDGGDRGDLVAQQSADDEDASLRKSASRQLAPAKGIILGAVLSMVVWAMMILTLGSAFH